MLDTPEKRIAFAQEVVRQLIENPKKTEMPSELDRSLAGLRYLTEIEKEMGRKLYESEWEGMSIR